jgi:hypothetical protein
MPTQLALSFDAVPVTCEVQQRYHSETAKKPGQTVKLENQ